MQHMTIDISGMSCGGCVSAVRRALGAVGGVEVESVAIGVASVRFDEHRATPGAVLEAIRKAGYQPTASGVPISPMLEDPVHCGCGHPHRRAAAKR